MAFFDINEQYKDNILAIDDEKNQVSYSDLYEYAMKMSDVIDHRCLVFLFASNSIGSIVNYLSFLNNRIVPVLLNWQIEKELASNLLDLYKPEYIILPDKAAEKYIEFETVSEGYGYKILKTDFDRKFDLYDELALLLTTSGSTGSPKLVRQSYKNIDANANSIAEYLCIDSKERPITSLPMNYTYGLSIINSHALKGATILVTDKSLMQKEFWSFLKEEEATSIAGVPYNYEILEKLRFFRMTLPSLKTMTQAGGKLSPELHKKFAEYARDNDKHFVVMYGQCEATARMAYLPYEKSLEKYGSMGVAIPGGKFTLIDAEGKEINDADTVGELVYEGPNVTLGYAERGEDLIKGDERGGVLVTGDMAKRDEEGYYYIVGRKKRFLKVYGNRVNLDETERLLKTKFDYMDCACGGVDDHMYIFVTSKEVENDVKDYISSITHLNPAAFSVVWIDEIPKNDSGKTKYSELEKYYN
ncbi:MAG: AMP-binding protein [Lachnospiraceae bacterium]|nr:AMP-binding protein [Lachnospiraceae bacterium]